MVQRIISFYVKILIRDIYQESIIYRLGIHLYIGIYLYTYIYMYRYIDKCIQIYIDK